MTTTVEADTMCKCKQVQRNCVHAAASQPKNRHHSLHDENCEVIAFLCAQSHQAERGRIVLRSVGKVVDRVECFDDSIILGRIAALSAVRVCAQHVSKEITSDLVNVNAESGCVFVLMSVYT